MVNLRDSEVGARGSFSVGGPGGIQIDGGRVQIGGGPTVGPPVLSQASAPLTAPVGSIDTTRLPELFGRHPWAIAAVLSITAGLLLSSAATVISVLQLPWLLLVLPTTFGAALLGIGGMVVLRARKRQTTGSLDPAVERKILDVAVACQGRVTVMAVARALGMPLAEADSALTVLARTGYVLVDNDPSTGVVVYVFPDVGVGLMPARRLP
jgi:hypothetical protein